MSSPSGAPPRAGAKKRVVRIALRIYLAFLALVMIAGGIEYYLEQRDLRTLTKGATFAELTGARVRYRLLASPAATQPLVVFLTDRASSIEEWEEVQPQLVPFAPSLTYDRAGTGFSRDSDAHDLRAQRDELMALLKVRNYAGPLIVVAHSAAAPLAKVVASMQPQRVKGLVLLEPMLPELQSSGASAAPSDSDEARDLLTRTVTAFLGLRRWSQGREEKPPATPREQRIHAVQVSFQHWAAVTAEWVFQSKNHQAAQEAKLPKDLTLLILGRPSYGRRLGGKPRDKLAPLLSRTSRSDYLEVDELDEKRLLVSTRVQHELRNAIQRALSESGTAPAQPPTR